VGSAPSSAPGAITAGIRAAASRWRKYCLFPKGVESVPGRFPQRRERAPRMSRQVPRHLERSRPRRRTCARSRPRRAQGPQPQEGDRHDPAAIAASVGREGPSRGRRKDECAGENAEHGEAPCLPSQQRQCGEGERARSLPAITASRATTRVVVQSVSGGNSNKSCSRARGRAGRGPRTSARAGRSPSARNASDGPEARRARARRSGSRAARSRVGTATCGATR